VFWLIAAFGVVIVAIGVVATGARAQASAERVAFLLGDPIDTSPNGCLTEAAPGSRSACVRRNRATRDHAGALASAVEGHR
jgi:hypothetical protein